VLEESAHGSTEGAGGVVHPEWHSSGLKQSKGGFEGSLPLIFLLNVYVVETPSQICFGENFLPLELVNDATDQGQWVDIPYSPSIEHSVVNDRAELAVFFGVEKDRGCIGGVHFYDVPLSQVLVNVFLQGF
jgi:hypothetical protein